MGVWEYMIKKWPDAASRPQSSPGRKPIVSIKAGTATTSKASTGSAVLWSASTPPCTTKPSLHDEYADVGNTMWGRDPIIANTANYGPTQTTTCPLERCLECKNTNV